MNAQAGFGLFIDYIAYQFWLRNYSWKLSSLRPLEMRSMTYGSLGPPDETPQMKSETGANSRESPEPGISQE